ncbi:CRISPR-associated helicase Cas3 [Syntrophotalea carbinolica DSM 2380]|uniref:CRISPR-associated helicase Cas3 n=1 Tax=Syntrophotalea carbinolica (strain DSM 2380 / NBRC 103641 / GraBd1) TaxID=338963 RepID=Q3A5Z8_SYNC1|nr:CRISPR-associated helicase/endonuclease Cas3 [Syntrophotalea carbinolica]ABA88209.1 CRISPR-associated helicase Cas3 [Syntrophotalea carbinolica DSM 2380]
MIDKENSFFRYWGKTADNGRYHLLPYHCLDVAAVGWLLLAPGRPLTKWLRLTLGVLPKWLRKWFVFLLALHDIGKFATAFQGIKPNLSEQLVPNVQGMSYNERHDSLGFLLWRKVISPLWSASGLGNEQDVSPSQLRAFEPWLKIVTGHHGIPPKDVLNRHQEYFTENDELAAKSFCRSVSLLFLHDIDLSILTDKKFKNRLQQCSWFLAGITVLADWIGSSVPADQYCSSEIPLSEYWFQKALPQAEQILATINLTPACCSSFAGINHLFPFIEQPTPLQAWATSIVVNDRPQLFILEDVTGAGKTEAAVTLCHRLLNADAADGIYAGMPTMATANAMYLRLGKAYQRLFSAEQKPSLVLAHGARHLSDAFRNSVGLPDNAGGNAEYEKNELSGEAYCHAWLADSRKKALLAEVGVGTLDQALLGILPARHQSLRLLGLSRKILLVDEVHAYDPYMNLLLQTLLQAHAANGGSAILLSATLPHKMREQYVQAFCSGSGGEAPALSLEAEYPLVTHVASHVFSEEKIATRQDVARSTAIDWLHNEGEVLDLIRKQVEQGHCVCWIRNTVGDARKAYDALVGCGWIKTGRLSLFHSRFAMIDRQRIEIQTLEFFGDNSDAEIRRGRVLVATQVVEQSLDLDFDVLISDLAPIDLLIQRAGREHRHIRDEFGNRTREKGATDRREPPVFYILAPEPSDTPEATWLKNVLPGTQAVYRHVGQLWLTQKILLKEQVIEPTKNSRILIEEVFGDEAQDYIPEALLDLSWDAEGDAGGKRGIARLNRLDLSKGYSRRSAEDSGGWDEDTNIPTRLSEQTVDVALVVKKGVELLPYAHTERFPWDMSTLSLPKGEWEQVQKSIPRQWQPHIDELREREKALKWIEVLPLVDELLPCYDKAKGWSSKKGDDR